MGIIIILLFFWQNLPLESDRSNFSLETAFPTIKHCPYFVVPKEILCSLRCLARPAFPDSIIVRLRYIGWAQFYLLFRKYVKCKLFSGCSSDCLNSTQLPVSVKPKSRPNYFDVSSREKTSLCDGTKIDSVFVVVWARLPRRSLATTTVPPKLSEVRERFHPDIKSMVFVHFRYGYTTLSNSCTIPTKLIVNKFGKNICFDCAIKI